MSEVIDRKTLRDALRVVFRRWPVFLLTASVFAFVALCGAHYVQLKYTGTAFFERRMDPAVDDVRGESFEAMKRTLAYRLGGREAVEKVVEAVGLLRGLPHGPGGQLTQEGHKVRQELVADFQKRLSVNFQVQSPTIDLVQVEFTHEDPELASKVPNLLVANYIEWAHQSIFDRLDASRRFLEEQSSKCKRQLDELEQQRLKFEAENAGKFLDRPDALQTRIDAVQSDLETLKAQQRKAKAELESLESLTGAARPEEQVPENEVADLEVEYRRMKGQLQELLGQLEVARQRFTDRHPTVIGIKENIGYLEARGEQIDARIVEELARLPLDPIDSQLLYADLFARLQKLADELRKPAPGPAPSEPAPTADAIKEKMAQLEEFAAKVLTALPKQRQSGELGGLLRSLQGGLKAARAVDAVADAENPAVKALREVISKLEDSLARLMPKALRDLQYRLVRLELQYSQDQLDVARQVRGLPEDSKRVISLKQEVASLGDLAGRLKTDLPMQVDPLRMERPLVRAEDLLTALTRAKSELDVTTAEIARLENQLVALNRKSDEAPPARQKYLEIVGKIRDQGIEGGRWKTRQNEIQMALEAEIAKRRTHLESVQTAQVQFVPSSPKLTMILAFACFGGLAFGGGVVFLLNFLDRSVSTTEEAANYFKVPVHGVIGEMVTRKQRLRKKIRRYLVGPAVALLVLGVLSVAMLSIGLKLKSPEKFLEWRSAPVKFVFDRVTATAGEVRRQAGS